MRQRHSTAPANYVEPAREVTPVTQADNRAIRNSFLVLSWILMNIPLWGLAYLTFDLLYNGLGLSQRAALNWTLLIYTVPGFLTARIALAVGSGDFVAAREVKERYRVELAQIRAQEARHEREMMIRQFEAAKDAEARKVEAQHNVNYTQLLERVRKLERYIIQHGEGTLERTQGFVPAAPEGWRLKLGELVLGDENQNGIYLPDGRINPDWVDPDTGRVKRRLPFAKRGSWPAEDKRRAIELLKNPPGGGPALVEETRDAGGSVTGYRWNVHDYPHATHVETIIGVV